MLRVRKMRLNKYKQPTMILFIVLDSNNFVNEEIEIDSNQEFYADNEKEQGGDVYQHID